MERVFSAPEHSLLEAFFERTTSEQAGAVSLIQLLNNHTSLSSLEEVLGYEFKSSELLIESITHRSFVHEFSPLNNQLKNNERLEFIGDSIINLVVSLELAQRFPSFQEGSLSKLRSALVNQSSLAQLANFLNLGKMILVGKGEYLQQGMFRDSMLADAFEALFAAIYLDSDFLTTQKCFSHLIKRYESANFVWANPELIENFDVKSKLQELTLKHFKQLPLYVCKEMKENSSFEMKLIINKKEFGPLITESKRKAEKELAFQALQYFSINQPIKNQTTGGA